LQIDQDDSLQRQPVADQRRAVEGDMDYDLSYVAH
jgi:hypothetical protein